MPLFSIIVVHYQGTISRETFARGIASLQNQTFRDFEILCYHDGALLDVDAPQPVPIRVTPQRVNDWGHSLRDLGIREALGDYLIFFNADNVLYPAALEKIANELRRPSRIFIQQTGQPLDTDNIVIFPILMHDMQRFLSDNVRLAPGSGCYMILTGNPPQMGLIDCMQLVMKRQLWLAEGGWRDKRQAGDAYMYPQFAAKYGYRAVGPVLGEHF
jgi:glycosyltransferase involved in cell wall biosynthesis